MSTKVDDFVYDLDGGVFAEKLSRALSDVAAGTVDHGNGKKKGKVVIELDMQQIGESHQIQISHTLKVSRPTLRGKATEEDTTTTPMYVGRGGKMTIAPDAQIDFLKTPANEEQ
ncbi:hypothetical protein MWU49_09265 [Alcanivorax sp. S6407]|uniref:hypothetical protein n=1 Tax=Alcanivorax sp. S6407 TaxID=2926424 RepID=UPI001FF67CD3|nr:hypothetical protein [Alcanivorax sp. S6407]MCK0153892.1 hypothetical protein [Alcanivorax sp. S6407]